MMSGGGGPSERNDGGSGSLLKGVRNEGELSSGVSYLRDKKDLSYNGCTLQSGIHEQSLELQDFDVDGFLGYLEAH